MEDAGVRTDGRCMYVCTYIRWYVCTNVPLHACTYGMDVDRYAGADGCEYVCWQ